MQPHRAREQRGRPHFRRPFGRGFAQSAQFGGVPTPVFGVPDTPVFGLPPASSMQRSHTANPSLNAPFAQGLFVDPLLPLGVPPAPPPMGRAQTFQVRDSVSGVLVPSSQASAPPKRSSEISVFTVEISVDRGEESVKLAEVMPLSSLFDWAAFLLSGQSPSLISEAAINASVKMNEHGSRAVSIHQDDSLQRRMQECVNSTGLVDLEEKEGGRYIHAVLDSFDQACALVGRLHGLHVGVHPRSMRAHSNGMAQQMLDECAPLVEVCSVHFAADDQHDDPCSSANGRPVSESTNPNPLSLRQTNSRDISNFFGEQDEPPLLPTLVFRARLLRRDDEGFKDKRERTEHPSSALKSDDDVDPDSLVRRFHASLQRRRVSEMKSELMNSEELSRRKRKWSDMISTDCVSVLKERRLRSMLNSESSSVSVSSLSRTPVSPSKRSSPAASANGRTSRRKSKSPSKRSKKNRLSPSNRRSKSPSKKESEKKEPSDWWTTALTAIDTRCMMDRIRLSQQTSVVLSTEQRAKSARDGIFDECGDRELMDRWREVSQLMSDLVCESAQFEMENGPLIAESTERLRLLECGLLKSDLDKEMVDWAGSVRDSKRTRSSVCSAAESASVARRDRLLRDEWKSLVESQPRIALELGMDPQTQRDIAEEMQLIRNERSRREAKALALEMKAMVGDSPSNAVPSLAAAMPSDRPGLFGDSPRRRPASARRRRVKSETSKLSEDGETVEDGLTDSESASDKAKNAQDGDEDGQVSEEGEMYESEEEEGAIPDDCTVQDSSSPQPKLVTRPVSSPSAMGTGARRMAARLGVGAGLAGVHPSRLAQIQSGMAQNSGNRGRDRDDRGKSMVSPRKDRDYRRRSRAAQNGGSHRFGNRTGRRRGSANHGSALGRGRGPLRGRGGAHSANRMGRPSNHYGGRDSRNKRNPR